MSVSPVHPEQIIEDIGGCGRFQVRMSIIAHVTKALVALSFMSMIVISATPTWWCTNTYSNSSSQPVCDIYNGSSYCLKKTCNINDTKYQNFQFGATAKTVVSEFVLICGLDYVPSTVMSIQTFGMLAGGLTAGQVSDLFGRKPPYFTGIALVTIFNCDGVRFGVFYGINFEIQALSGNIFLNLFLFNVAEIPSKLITTWLMNILGRRRSTALCFVVVAASAFVVGVVQKVGAPNKDLLVNVFAIIAKMGISSAWGPIQTMTIEIYPTVIRNIGFGSQSVVARIGAMIGPQLVYLDTYFHGLLFFVCGSIAVLCILSLVWLPETRNANLSDNISKVDISVIEPEPLKQPKE